MKKAGKIYVTRNRRKKKKLLTVQSVTAVLSVIIVLTVLFIIVDGIRNKPDTSSQASSFIGESQPASSDPADISSESETVSQISENSTSASSSLVTSGVVSGEARDNSFTQLKAAVQSFAEDFDGRIAVSYINLANGEIYDLNEKLPFVAASSIKMSIVTQLYKRIAEGELELTQTLKYDSRPYPEGDYEFGSGVVYEQPDGTEFSIGRTAQLAITISDNCATNMIIRKLGGIDAVAPLLDQISAVVPYRQQISYKNYKDAFESGKHRTSSKDLATYASYLYESWRSDKEAFDPLMNDLQNTIFDFGVQTLLPEGTIVAHKIGTNNNYRAENDVGIVFADEPYVICVMTETEIQSEGRGAVAEVSLMFYEYISSLYN